jgi:ABC-type transport system substrate-binding protein
MMIREALSKVGIQVELEVVEPGVFLAAIKRGQYQLFSSRWIGVADGSILYRTLRTGEPRNRVGYSNPKMDRILEQAISEPDPRKRIPLLKSAQSLMAEDLPYFPLWYWRNALIVRKELAAKAQAITLSLSGALDPLIYLLPHEQ